MVYLVLNDLSRPAEVDLGMGFHIRRLIFYLDGLISLTFSRAAKKGQAAFLGVVCAALFDDLGVEHNGVRWHGAAFVKKGDNAFTNTDHICRHTDTAFSVSHKSFKQITGNLHILLCCSLGSSSEKERIVHKLFYHINQPFLINVILAVQSLELLIIALG